MYLNLGCGTDYLEGWTNVDVRKNVKTDICCSIKELDKFIVEDTVDQIQATNVLEHIGWRDRQTVLEMLYKLLKVGGNLLIRGPDIKRVVDKYLQGAIQEDKFIEVVYGKEDYNENSHKSGWSEKGLEKMLQGVGFKEVGVTWRDDSWGFEIGAKK